MPTPTKPYIALVEEGKSHRTKAELKRRQREEASLATGTEIKERSEVSNNPVAHKEFLRISKLLTKIKKNDAIYEPVINRYCSLQAECRDLEIKREKIFDQAVKLEKMLDNFPEDIDFANFRAVVSDLGSIYAAMIAIDKQVQAKRKMILDIEKENIMTIAAALRSIPKKEEKSNNKLLEALNGGKG